MEFFNTFFELQGPKLRIHLEFGPKRPVCRTAGREFEPKKAVCRSAGREFGPKRPVCKTAGREFEPKRPLGELQSGISTKKGPSE